MSSIVTLMTDEKFFHKVICHIEKIFTKQNNIDTNWLNESPSAKRTQPTHIPIGLIPKIIVPKLNRNPCAEMASIGVSFFPDGDKDFNRELIRDICAGLILANLEPLIASWDFPRIRAWFSERKMSTKRNFK